MRTERCTVSIMKIYNSKDKPLCLVSECPPTLRLCKKSSEGCVFLMDFSLFNLRLSNPSNVDRVEDKMPPVYIKEKKERKNKREIMNVYWYTKHSSSKIEIYTFACIYI